MQKAFILAFAIFGIILISCSEENKIVYDCDHNNTSFAPMGYTFVDTSCYYFTKNKSLMAYREYVINWETSLGEPFTDINGNGIYDQLIDSFVKVLDPAINQDLNRNNRYDGPGDPWEPGIPFDDIDGNGEFRGDALKYSMHYEPGLPFTDFNNNGKWDSVNYINVGISRFKIDIGEDGNKWIKTIHDRKIEHSKYRFISDSGVAYDIPFGLVESISGFCITDSNLIFHESGFAIPVLDTGDLEFAVEEFSLISRYDDTLNYIRTTTPDIYIHIDGYYFYRVVEVAIVSDSLEYTFHFSKNTGFIGFERRYYHNSKWNEISFYYLKRIDRGDDMIFPMTR